MRRDCHRYEKKKQECVKKQKTADKRTSLCPAKPFGSGGILDDPLRRCDAALLFQLRE